MGGGGNEMDYASRMKIIIVLLILGSEVLRNVQC